MQEELSERLKRAVQLEVRLAAERIRLQGGSLKSLDLSKTVSGSCFLSDILSFPIDQQGHLVKRHFYLHSNVCRAFFCDWRSHIVRAGFFYPSPVWEFTSSMDAGCWRGDF